MKYLISVCVIYIKIFCFVESNRKKKILGQFDVHLC